MKLKGAIKEAKKDGNRGGDDSKLLLSFRSARRQVFFEYIQEIVGFLNKELNSGKDLKLKKVLKHFGLKKKESLELVAVAPPGYDTRPADNETFELSLEGLKRLFPKEYFQSKNTIKKIDSADYQRYFVYWYGMDGRVKVEYQLLKQMWVPS